MPWVILPCPPFVEFLGLTAKEYDEHNNNKAMMLTMAATMATAMAATPPTRMAVRMAIMTKVTWTAMAAVTTTTTTMMSTTTTTTMGRQQCNGDNNDGMAAI